MLRGATAVYFLVNIFKIGQIHDFGSSWPKRPGGEVCYCKIKTSPSTRPFLNVLHWFIVTVLAACYSAPPRPPINTCFATPYVIFYCITPFFTTTCFVIFYPTFTYITTYCRISYIVVQSPLLSCETSLQLRQQITRRCVKR